MTDTIYLIKDVQPSRTVFKIGRTKQSAEIRKKSITKGQPQDNMTIVQNWVAASGCETFLHKKFADFRIKAAPGQEWFSFADLPDFSVEWLVSRISELIDEYSQFSEKTKLISLIPYEIDGDFVKIADGDHIIKTIEEWENITTQIWLLEYRKQTLQNDIKLRIMKGAGFHLPDGRNLTSKIIETQRLDIQNLKRNHPEIVEEYLRVTKSRRLSF